MLGRKMLGCRPQAGDKLLWIRFNAFGDVLQAAASAYRFSRRFPEVRVTFLTDPKFVKILSQQPYIHEVIAWDTQKKNLDFLKILAHARGGYRWLVSMHRGAAAAAVSFLSGIPKRFGYNGGTQFAYTGTPWEFLDALDVDFTCRDEPCIFASEEDSRLAQGLTERLPEQKIFAVIGASQRQKLWPVEHWIDFLRPLLAQGWGAILNGYGDKEERMALEIANELKSPNLRDLSGRLPFPLMAAVAKNASIAVGNDTGPLHLAALAGTPTLGFFGPTDAHEMSYRMPWFRQLKAPCPRAGCHDYACPKACLADISPESALAAFQALAASVEKPSSAL